MEEALSFFRAFEAWIYLLLGLGGLIYLRKFILAWEELRGAGFGLERESAQSRLNQSASVLVLLLAMAVTEFVLVTFVTPAVPGASPLPTPTLNILATPTTTLPASTPEVPGEQPTATVPLLSLPVDTNCPAGQIAITSPVEGQEVSGIVEVKGSADIPDFGFYKFEMKRPDETSWLTLLAGNTPVQDGDLGLWDTRRLSPGEYQLGLVVSNNQGSASEPCVVQVRVTQPANETANP
jgi:hypothetical protein